MIQHDVLPATQYRMFHYTLVYMAYYFSRWLPKNQRCKFQIINVVFVMLVLTPQVYVLTSPRSSRYCQQDLFSNLSASIVLSFVAIGFAVIFTLMDPVPQGCRAANHMFGLVSFGQGLCTIIMTLTAATCAKTTPELYYLSLILSVACILSSACFGVKGGLRDFPLSGLRDNEEPRQQCYVSLDPPEKLIFNGVSMSTHRRPTKWCHVKSHDEETFVHMWF